MIRGMNTIAFWNIISILYLMATQQSTALMTTPAAEKYLHQFGYLRAPKCGRPLTDDEISDGIRQFQRFVKLPESGKFDQTTLAQMEKPRCGNPDILDGASSKRKKRYVLQGSKWNKNKLTYKVESCASNLTRAKTEEEIGKSFGAWEAVANLWFKCRSPGEAADIAIRFTTGNYDGDESFDGAGGIFAYGFCPEKGGGVYFDDAEPWVAEKRCGDTKSLKLGPAATHELGHSLGLFHSDNPQSIMFPYYNDFVTELSKDDIDGIRAIYGVQVDKKPKSLVLKCVSANLQQCPAKFDAVTTMSDGSIFAFSKNFFWKIIEQGLEKDSVQSIEKVWGFHGAIDASLTHNGFTDLFQGKHVRRFISGKPVQGYPKLISDQYPGIPTNIDAAWSGDGFIYFAKGPKYWVFNSATNKAYASYPRLISKWKGLPDSVDAAFQWNNSTYFFKDGQYWRFDDKVPAKSVQEPRKTNVWLPGCVTNSDLGTSQEEDASSAISAYKVGVQVTISLILVALSLMY